MRIRQVSEVSNHDPTPRVASDIRIAHAKGLPTETTRYRQTSGGLDR